MYVRNSLALMNLKCLQIFIPIGINFNNAYMTENFQNDGYMTGGAYDFQRATTSLTNQSISSSKKVTLVRHGLSSWNEEGRVQVSFFSAFYNSFIHLLSFFILFLFFFWGGGGWGVAWGMIVLWFRM